jgi:hypothetical protein
MQCHGGIHDLTVSDRHPDLTLASLSDGEHPLANLRPANASRFWQNFRSSEAEDTSSCILCVLCVLFFLNADFRAWPSRPQVHCSFCVLCGASQLLPIVRGPMQTFERVRADREPFRRIIRLQNDPPPKFSRS